MGKRATTLTNQSVLALLNRPDVIAAFPKLQRVKKKLRGANRGCRCRGSKQRNSEAAISDLKTMMAGWSSEKKVQLKKLLGVDQVQLYVGKKLVKF